MKKLLLILAISASAAMADVTPKDDLLSIATAGKTAGTQFEMSKEDMQKADGGATWYNSYSGIGSRYYNSNTRAISSSATTKSSIYASAFRNYYW